AKDQRLLERLRQFEEVTDAIASETKEKKPEVAIRAMARGEKQIQMKRWLAPAKKGEHGERWKNEELVEQNRVILETLKRHPAALREVMAALKKGDGESGVGQDWWLMTQGVDASRWCRVIKRTSYTRNPPNRPRLRET
ncbi:MAG: hypothetical protein ACKV22_38245, partial [Bryobacteraceae bacterium]